VADSIEPSLRALIGTRAAPQTELVTRRDIRKYSVATAQRLQKYIDGDIAPPFFHLSLFWPVVLLTDIASDGCARDALFPEAGSRRPLAGGMKVEYYRPIRPGDFLTANRTLASIYEKQGSSGTLLFFNVTTRVTNASDELVLIETTTRIQR
jgi:hydroxyacyl-ACP dehydratase HTD2-like protein with hotdog domain